MKIQVGSANEILAEIDFSAKFQEWKTDPVQFEGVFNRDFFAYFGVLQAVFSS